MFPSLVSPSAICLMVTFCAYSAQEKREQGKQVSQRAQGIYLLAPNNWIAFNETYVSWAGRHLFCFLTECTKLTDKQWSSERVWSRVAFQSSSRGARHLQSLSVTESFRRNACLMAWSIVIGVVNWWSGCKFLSHGCHYLSSPSFIVLPVYPSLSLPSTHSLAPPLLWLAYGQNPCPSLVFPPSYWLEKETRGSLSWNIHSWNPSNCPVEIHLIKLFTVRSCGSVCVGRQPTASIECGRFGGWGLRGAAVATDVPPNCRFHHAETILLDHFKASAIGVTARLNQLQKIKSRFHSSSLNWAREGVIADPGCLPSTRKWENECGILWIIAWVSNVWCTGIIFLPFALFQKHFYK